MAVKMSILQRLWQEIWLAEERKKDKAKNDYVNSAMVRALDTAQSLYGGQTELQKTAVAQGGREQVPDPYGDSLRYGQHANATNLFGASTYHRLMSIQQATNQLVKSQMAHQMNTNVFPPTQPVFTSAGGSTSAQQQAHNVTVYGGGGGGSPGVAIGQSIQNVAYPVRHLGNSKRDTLFLALKGIEEAAIYKPEGNSDYDGKAVRFLDMRKYNEEEPVSLLGLCSFCVANCYPPMPLIELLRGFGIMIDYKS